MGGDFLQFMVEIWTPPTINKRTGLTLPCILEKDEDNNNDNENMTKDERNVVKVVAKPSFPFLDMRMFGDNDGNLAFGVYRKEGLTFVMEKNKSMTIDKLYPEHIGALRKAGLTPKKFPTLDTYS
eukprot:10047225-Ditylum_brightwellii.AAC.1